MSYNENLVSRIRESLFNEQNVEEKKMFQGLCFMVNDKMCICVRNDEIMCRIDPDKIEAELERGNCREMIHNGKIIKGYIFVSEDGYKSKKDFYYWITLCLEFNKKAKASKSKKKNKI